jgi:hypothetical protein
MFKKLSQRLGVRAIVLTREDKTLQGALKKQKKRVT